LQKLVLKCQRCCRRLHEDGGVVQVNSVMNFNDQLKTEEGCYTVVLNMPVFIVYTWKELNLLCCIFNHLKAC